MLSSVGTKEAHPLIRIENNTGMYKTFRVDFIKFIMLSLSLK